MNYFNVVFATPLIESIKQTIIDFDENKPYPDAKYSNVDIQAYLKIFEKFKSQLDDIKGKRIYEINNNIIEEVNNPKETIAFFEREIEKRIAILHFGIHL